MPMTLDKEPDIKPKEVTYPGNKKMDFADVLLTFLAIGLLVVVLFLIVPHYQ